MMEIYNFKVKLEHGYLNMKPSSIVRFNKLKPTVVFEKISKREREWWLSDTIWNSV